MSVVQELIQIAKEYTLTDRPQEASVIMRACVLLLQKREEGIPYPWENDLSLAMEVVTHMQDELLRVTEKVEKLSGKVLEHGTGHYCDNRHRSSCLVPTGSSCLFDERSVTKGTYQEKDIHERVDFLYTEMCSQQERIDALTMTVGNLSANVARWYAIACKKDERYEEE